MAKSKPSVSCRADHCAIIEAHNNGLSIEKLCQQFGLKKGSINRIIKNYEHCGLSLVIKPKGKSKPMAQTRSKLNKDQLEKILCYYNSAAKSYSDVQKFIFYMFGVTIPKPAVGYYLRRARKYFPSQIRTFSDQSSSSSSHQDNVNIDLSSTQMTPNSCNGGDFEDDDDDEEEEEFEINTKAEIDYKDHSSNSFSSAHSQSPQSPSMLMESTLIVDPESELSFYSEC